MNFCLFTELIPSWLEEDERPHSFSCPLKTRCCDETNAAALLHHEDVLSSGKAKGRCLFLGKKTSLRNAAAPCGAPRRRLYRKAVKEHSHLIPAWSDTGGKSERMKEGVFWGRMTVRPRGQNGWKGWCNFLLHSMHQKIKPTKPLLLLLRKSLWGLKSKSSKAFFFLFPKKKKEKIPPVFCY